MIEILGAFVLGGAAGVYVKSTLIKGKSQQSGDFIKTDTIYIENEKLRKRNKEAEDQVEDLIAELSKLRKKISTNNDEQDDIEDELQKSITETKKLKLKYDDMVNKLNEYHRICEYQETEISTLKEKLKQ